MFNQIKEKYKEFHWPTIWPRNPILLKLFREDLISRIVTSTTIHSESSVDRKYGKCLITCNWLDMIALPSSVKREEKRYSPKFLSWSKLLTRFPALSKSSQIVLWFRFVESSVLVGDLCQPVKGLKFYIEFQYSITKPHEIHIGHNTLYNACRDVYKCPLYIFLKVNKYFNLIINLFSTKMYFFKHVNLINLYN